MIFFRRISLAFLVVAAAAAIAWPWCDSSRSATPPDRQEVIFWHFWGGADRDVVESVARRFNEQQAKYWVRAVAVPGNNLDAKLFLSVAGGNPPDLVNQDDPVLADWYDRGVLQTVEEFAGSTAADELRTFLLPAARRLVLVDDRWVAVPNGLDVRALFYNASLLEQRGWEPPRTLAEFNRLIWALSPTGDTNRDWFAFLPDPRRIWAWGYVFGGNFVDGASGRTTIDDPPIVAATEWMQEFSRAYGPDSIARFRQADQSLPGKTFPLLPIGDEAEIGRYAFVLDGQWRVRDIEAFAAARRSRGKLPPRFAVCPLPPPETGRHQSGWVNGNFFIVPRGAKNPAGAWAFIRFWIGLSDPAEAARTCVEGGWIPVSSAVFESPTFRQSLREHPLMAAFVDLAGSDQLFPYPRTRGAMYFRRSVEAAAARAISHPELPAREILREAQEQIQRQLDRIHQNARKLDAR
jgi:multiple sugar transport system substrate-binding protein